MTNQDTTSTDEKIEAIFARIWNGDYYQSHEATLEDCKQAIKQLIAQETTKARIEELEKIWGDDSLENDDVAENVRLRLVELRGKQ